MRKLMCSCVAGGKHLCCTGGESAGRLASALAEVCLLGPVSQAARLRWQAACQHAAGLTTVCAQQDGELVVYGCASGKPPSFAWQSWVFSGLQVTMLHAICAHLYLVSWTLSAGLHACTA